VKNDQDVSDEDWKRFHVVLFGDPGSNKLIAKILGKLPLKWTRQTITLGDKTFSAAEHIPALIYPNPLNPAHYIVLNSGLTVEDRDYPASDYLTPRLGDFAIIKVKDAPGMPEPAVAGLFDENWRLPKEIPLAPPMPPRARQGN
jgi:hypothetical protein